jgi:hypothetical protein
MKRYGVAIIDCVLVLYIIIAAAGFVQSGQVKAISIIAIGLMIMSSVIAHYANYKLNRKIY